MPSKAAEIEKNMFKDWSVGKLKQEYSVLHNAITNLDCFSVSDLTQQELIARELERRGYEINEEHSVSFTKVR